MNKQFLFLAASLLVSASVVFCQQPAVAPPESLVVEGVPAIPGAMADTAGRYGAYRSAAVVDWHPTERSVLINTRFAETPQLHLVGMPGGERRQLTFFQDAVRLGRFHPNGGDYIVFSKDVGGGEWYQLYRYDVATASITLLSDGKSRNTLGPWSARGDEIAYTSTRRAGKDMDLWVMNPADAKSDHLLTQLSGGGWEPLDWSPDDSKILLLEEISINESYLWLVDTKTGEKTPFTPRDAKEKVSYGEGRFSKDGKGIFITTDKDSEFHRLAYIDLATKQHQYLTDKIPWDVDTFDLSHDGQRLALLEQFEHVGEDALNACDFLLVDGVARERRRAGLRGVVGARQDGSAAMTASPSSPTSTPTCQRSRRRLLRSRPSASRLSTAAAIWSATARTPTRSARSSRSSRCRRSTATTTTRSGAI